MKVTFLAVAALAALATATSPARANVVTDWCDKASEMSYVVPGGPGTGGARAVAMAHIAMFEAVNSIEPRYTPYRALLPAQKGSSPEAAASAAAHGVLTKLVTDPAKLKDIEAFHAATLARIPDGEAKASGIELGQRAAAAIIAERADDGSKITNDYRPATAPGVYVPTLFPVAIGWGRVKPFGMKSADHFRAPPPYALTSAEWARDYNEVKRLGGKVSERTEEQTQIAKFWELVGPSTYNPLGLHLVKAKNLDTLDSARVLALLSIATFDAGLAVFEAKYTYNFWRPVTAIRNGDTDGNDATVRDASWEPFIPTPMHPEYPCAHCTFQSSAAAALRGIFGDDIVPEASLVSSTAPGVNRKFRKLSDYVNEVINARIYDGVHYRASGIAGAEMGRQVGEYAVANYLKPMR